VNPVDPRPALHGVDRPDRAQEQDRNAVAPRIEDRHRRVHQPDIGVQSDRERHSGDARIPVRECDRGFLVDAEQKLRPRVAEIVDEAVVQPAKARAGGQRDVGDRELAQELRDRIAAPGGGFDLRNVAGSVVHLSPPECRNGGLAQSSRSARNCSVCGEQGQCDGGGTRPNLAPPGAMVSAAWPRCRYRA
jgi:hypothetical protein